MESNTLQNEVSVLFVSIILLGCFGPGLQSIPIFTLLFMLANLLLSFLIESWKIFATLAFLANCLATFFAYMFLLGRDSFSVVFVFGFAALLGGATTLLVWAPSKYLLQHSQLRFKYYHIYIFPVLVTALWSLSTSAFPSGSFGNWAYSVTKFNSLTQVVSLFGLDGINFIVAWTASVVFHFQFVRRVPHITMLKQVSSNTRNEIEGSEEGMDSMQNSRILSKTVFDKPGHIWFFTLVLLFFYSGARQLNWRGSFFQTDITEWNAEQIMGRCKIGYPDEEYGGTVYSRIAETEAELNSSFGQDIDIYLWSESCVAVYNSSERDFLYSETQRLALENNVLIGMTFIQKYVDPRDSKGQRPERNMFFISSNNGKIVLDYQKVHPVVGDEINVAPGKYPAKVFSSPFGINIGAAICYDYDFPVFINDAVKEGGMYADLMLQPGWDWGAIGILHARMETIRAIENGVSLFRCSSGGVSGIYDQFGGIVYEKVTNKYVGDGFKVEIPVLPRVGTLYIHIGGLFGYLCIALLLAFLSYPCYTYALKRNQGKSSQNM